MPGSSSLIARLWRQQSGASAAEFALVLPILTILLVGAIDVGGMAWTKMQVGAAARAGASYALTNGFDESGVSAAITNATNLTVTAETPQPTYGCPDAVTGVTMQADPTPLCTGGVTPGRYVTVGASSSYNLIFAWPGLSDPLPLTAEARVRIS